MAEAFYEDEDNLKKLCDFLRGKEGPAVREAIEMDKRVYYLKGESSESVGSPSERNAESATCGNAFVCTCGAYVSFTLHMFLTIDIQLLWPNGIVDRSNQINIDRRKAGEFPR